MAEPSSEKFLISCREATFLITRKREQPIGLRNRIRLIVHLLICEFCRRFSTQTRLIEKQARRIAFDGHLTLEEKRRLEKVIESGGSKTA